VNRFTKFYANNFRLRVKPDENDRHRKPEGGVDMRKGNGVIFGVVGFIVLFLCTEGGGADWKFIANPEKSGYK